MKRIVLRSLVLIAATHIVVSTQGIAQVRCGLTEADAPSVRGLRLGMTTEQLLAVFPGSAQRAEIKAALEKAKAPDSELVYLAFEPADGAKERFEGVAGISAGVSGGRVMEFTVQYIGPDWRRIEDWVAKLSETLKLPGVDGWQSGPNESPNRVLTCKGVDIEAVINGGGGSVKLRNTDYHRAAQERMRAKEETKKRDYKP